ncbi:hypothetical protein [Legionella nagasakiensis]|uniref:hypothetical protein n=1 Tax=Legionella nagasakiensis TaxID=535290 RepID=UPI0010561314|nr:hypothetical protein [Legionella nagasakiensis]
MLPLSNFTITIKPSKDYLKLAILSHGLAMFALLQSALPLSIIMIMAIVLLFSLHSIFHISKDPPTYNGLSFQSGAWFLHRYNGQQIKYEHLSIFFDAGFFFIVALTNHDVRKTLTIFTDQITSSQKRIFMYYGKIKKK